MERAPRSMLMTRRRLAAWALVAGANYRLGQGTPERSPRPSPVALNYGLEIRDYRILPTLDTTRFIIEIYNATDESIDMPSVGFTMPNLPAGQDFGFAIPTNRVLHAHSSGVLMGAAPPSIENDQDLASAEWLLCDDPQTHQADKLNELNLSLSYLRVSDNEDYIYLEALVTNQGSQTTNAYGLGCEIFDSLGRVCGMAPVMESHILQPGQAVNYPVEVSRTLEYIGSPFILVDSALEMEVQITLQPRKAYAPVGCPLVMPWNR